MTPQQQQAAWDAAIAETKKLVTVKSKNQMMVAELALGVCEISWGGGNMRGKYTLTRFATEVGMHLKTLSHWCSVYRNVYEVLPARARKMSFTKISHINVVAGPSATRQQVMEAYDKIANTNAFDSKIKRQIADLRTLSWNFTQNNAAQKCDKDTLEEVLFYTQSINREIENQHPGLKPKSHGIAALRVHNTSLAKALGIPRHKGESRALVATPTGSVVVTPKDRDIANFIKNANGFVRPTDIAVKLKGNAEHTAWVNRSIEKLMAAGVLERNKAGHYRWK